MNERLRGEKCAMSVVRSLVLLVIILCFPVLGFGQGQSSGKWSIQKKVDPINDKVSMYAGVVNGSRENLVIACLNGERLASAIEWGLFSPFGISFEKQRDVEVLVRFDQNKPERMNWIIGKSGRHTVLHNRWDSDEFEKFLKNLKGHSKVVVRAKGMNSGTMTKVFSLFGSAYAIETVEHACGLLKEKPKKKKIVGRK